MALNLALRNPISTARIPDAERDAPDASAAGIDWILLSSTLALCVMGLISIFSATHINPETGLTSYHFLQRQLLGIVLGVPVVVLAWRIDYRRVMRRHSLIYAANLLTLIAVLKLGRHEVNGAQRWISLGSFQLQPSEIAKIAIIITLAAYLASHQSTIRDFRTVMISLIHVAIPALVIFKQPDLGTALVLFNIWLVMIFIAGARKRHLGAILLTAFATFAVLWCVGGVKQYQKDRLSVFVHAKSDPQGVGYHITQAKDAIGSGRLWGKGLLHGSQGQLGYIPEQHTDFIFTIVGEELGFAGSAGLVLLYLVFLWRGCVIARETDDPAGRLLASGIVAMFLYHIVVNIGMTIGVMPVTGVPLPFMSYGGSSMIANLCAVGLLQSVRSGKPRLSL